MRGVLSFVVPVLLAGLVAGLLASPVHAQSLYGMDGGGATVWEFTLAPGGACPAPNPVAVPCPYAAALPCPGGPLGAGPTAPPPTGILGDVAVDSTTDTFFLTDGFVIEQYGARGPCGTPPMCLPLSVFRTGPGIGPLTGLGYDELGAVTGGVPALWITDGTVLAAVTPPAPGTCGAATFLYGPCPVPLPPGVLATDVTWDPVTASLWVCDTVGSVTNVLLVGGGCVAGAVFTPAACGLVPPLQGIAYDLATPDLVTGTTGALFVTDGFAIESLDVTGAVAAGTFYAPLSCTPAPGPLNGLAWTSNAVTYGKPRITATLTSWGQSTSPSGIFGVEITGSPAGTTPFLILNFNVPGPGLFCPPVPGVGTLFWVDPSPPAVVLALPPLPSGCVPIAIPLGTGVPTGVRAFMQVVYIPTGGPPAADATNGLAFTFTAP